MGRKWRGIVVGLFGTFRLQFLFRYLSIFFRPTQSHRYVQSELSSADDRINVRSWTESARNCPLTISFERLNRSSNKCITASLRTHHNRRRKKEATRKNDVVIKNINFQGMRAAKYKVTETSL